MRLKYKIALVIIGILLAGSISIGVSYSLWIQTFEGVETNVIQSGCFQIEFEELTESINLTNTYPMSDISALSKVSPYRLKLSNICNTTDAGYSMTLNTLELEEKEKIDDSKIKVAVGENSAAVTSGDLLSDLQINTELESINSQISGTLITSYVIHTGMLERGKSKTFDVYLWVDESAGNEVMNQVFNASVVITSYSAIIPEKVATFGINERVVTLESGLYEVGHPESELTETFSEDLTEDQIANLKLTEYRYAGANPNNYVTFNDEVSGWRIIGLVNTPEGQRVKLIRDESIGTYLFDSSDTEVNNGFGTNEWSTSKVKELLNEGLYYTRSSGSCYQDNEEWTCDYTSNGLTEEAKSLIDTVTWNTGANTSADYTSDGSLPSNFYNYERSNNTEKLCTTSDETLGYYCNDEINRTSIWSGQIGLMYPSDYGYATIGGSTIDRDACLNNGLDSWNENDCRDNNWLYKADLGVQWTMTPFRSINYSNWTFSISDYGYITQNSSDTQNEVRPTLYLKPDVKVVSGNGTKANPYIFGF